MLNYYTKTKKPEQQFPSRYQKKIAPLAIQFIKGFPE
jgi:hypothetical protein